MILRVAFVYTAVELLSLFDHTNLVERFSTGMSEAGRQTARMSPTTSLPELSFNHADAWWHNTKSVSLMTFIVLGLMTIISSVSVIFLSRLRSRTAWSSLLVSLLLTCFLLCFTMLFYLWNHSVIASLCLPYHSTLDYAFENVQGFDLTAKEVIMMLRVCSEEDNLAIALVKTSQVYGYPMQYAGMEVDPKTESVSYQASSGRVTWKPLQETMHVNKELKCHVGGALCMNVLEEVCEEVGPSFEWMFWANLTCLLASFFTCLVLY